MTQRAKMCSMARNTAKPYQRGKTWWIKFYRNGQAIRESAPSTDEAAAIRLLKIRLGQVASGEYRGPVASQVQISTLLDLVISDYEISKKRSLKDLKFRVERNIRPHLGSARAATFGSAQADKYIQSRRDEGAADSTINRELAICAARVLPGDAD